MSDREEIIACYEAMYEGMIHKDTEKLRQVLDDTYVLVHMTGSRMSLNEYCEAIRNGTLNYYRYAHEHESVSVHGDTAFMTGDTRVEAAVYGGSKHTWPLRLNCEFAKKDGVWKMTKSAASIY